jgi:hypothetical protein
MGVGMEGSMLRIVPDEVCDLGVGPILGETSRRSVRTLDP